MLQDSLGGNAYSCMIVNVAPEERHYLDTVSTLNLARKSKKIVNTVTVNEDIIGKLILLLISLKTHLFRLAYNTAWFLWEQFVEECNSVTVTITVTVDVTL